MRDMTRDMYLWVWISKDCMAVINWGKDVTLIPQRTWRSIKAVHLKAWNSSPILELWQNRQDLSCRGMLVCRPNSISSR